MNIPVAPVAERPAVEERIFFGSGDRDSAPRASLRVANEPPSVERFGLRHLKTASEIEQILYLRTAIDLSVHSQTGADFLALEKKETSAASSGPSNCVGTP